MELANILASQMTTMTEMRIQNAQREAMQNAAAFQQMRAVSYMGGAVGVCAQGGAGGAGATLNIAAVPEHVDQAQAFIARQLVAQAQSDYRVALERGKNAEAEAARVRMQSALLCEEVTTHRARADRAEATLAKLQPRIRRELISPLFSHELRRGSYELKWPWLAASWAFVIAGVAVCLL